jgi:hypothetical protein
MDVCIPGDVQYFGWQIGNFAESQTHTISYALVLPSLEGVPNSLHLLGFCLSKMLVV